MADGKVPCSVCVNKPVTCKTLPSTYFHGPHNFSLTRSIDRLHYSNLNYGLAFSIEDRQALGIHGLLPPRVLSLQEQVEQTMKQIRSYKTDIEKYVYIMELASHHEKLFYKVMKSYTEEMLPLVYTPTVGTACQMFSHLYKSYFKALFITIYDKGHIYEILKNWPVQDVKAIVVTDGERILGIGDQGIDGIGIPIGKLFLYTALAGIKPHLCLPIVLDFGTNSEAKLNDPLYLGLRIKRTEGKECDEFWDEFMQSVAERFGSTCLIQFEDIGNANAFKLLEKYQNLYCCFNDDIQGTSAVTVAGLLASLRITKRKLIDNVIVFQGAGEANIGIAELCVDAMKKEGVCEEEARSKIWMVDSKGLIVKNRPSGGITIHKEAFAHEHSPIESLDEIVREIKPSVLIGASSTPGAFSPGILKQMTENAERPIIFALSNPTSRSECTAEDAYKYTDGKCIFASGSPFPPVELNGKKFYPAQSNNSYCFPGIALGILCSGMKTVDDEVFLVVAECLAGLADEKDLENGSLFPPLDRIIDMVSIRIAQAVMNHAYTKGLASVYPEPFDKISYIKNHQYNTEMSEIFPTKYKYPC
ncbi:hypothetical protein WA026_016569 [Henosepilachna vigintioctopunctata]|uniref:Malic enzyme n=1 Tax=Henosepilachna vigintioctopunctata TaxID=420089 RepID=A0AAW1V9D9_9CUCU